MTTTTADFDPRAIFEALVSRRASFVVIGGLAADAHGVGWSTFDVYIVIECSPANYDALMLALLDLQAVFHTAHQPPIRPDVARLRSATGTLLFRTAHGRLDMLKDAGARPTRRSSRIASTASSSGRRCRSLAWRRSSA